MVLLKTRRLAIKGIFVIALMAISVFIAAKAGNSIVESDQLIKSDVILALDGSIPDRLLHSVDLYFDSLAPLILQIETNRDSWKHLEERGVYLKSESEQFREASIQLGVPPESIKILPGNTKSTLDEALVLRDYTRIHPAIDSIIIVSSSFHTRRTSLIFKTVFRNSEEDVVVLVSPSPYSDYNPQKWWASREKIQKVFYEWTKMIAFMVFEQWGIKD